MAYTKLIYHIVFSTKERRPFLQDEALPEVRAYIGGALRDQSAHPVAVGGMADHLHLAVIARPTTRLSDLMREVKANSSKSIQGRFPTLKVFAWQDGYSAFSVSESVLPDVVKYIQGQQAHHKKQTFQEELLALLARHGVEYDPRYIWT
ncbi:MAG: IS200/IS605 family transposase [Planctomycetota bacterium]